MLRQFVARYARRLETTQSRRGSIQDPRLLRLARILHSDSHATFRDDYWCGLVSSLVETGVATAGPARDANIVDGWIRDVGALCVFMRQGLAPLVAAKLVTLVERELSITEPTFGTYMTAGLEIALVGAVESRVAVVRPWGLSLLGVVEAGVARALNARGRVDLECGGMRVILLRFDDRGTAKWVAFIGGEARALDEKAFLELLSRITEVRSLAPSRRATVPRH